ncbi:hypothetical protein HRD84_13045 [Enterococcus faecalis]|uniref:HipA family kinase n=1 Tax=Enterococcus faecalis TaxID=1351 RepID=UPI00156E17AD|nr:HipA family kinase [Enterococcus faecalis]EGO7801132.1 hypothetical protein [Enterococcus faecalis]NSN06742.1 hypothetical protein [Enterococcus faecalis]NSU14941.1 hypothetical protein [Enterococcus faecalis]HBI1901278.1 hypothetical protein [Enterococcus faecalis]
MDIVYNFKRAINNGVTKPALISTKDGDQYIIKFLHSDCNGKVLFNELVAYRLAKLLDVPTPNCELLELNKKFIDNNEYFQELNAQPCICFASKYLKGVADISPVFLKASQNTKDIPSIILFDQIIMNEDRSVNPGNILYSSKSKKIIAIDHSHIFRNGMIWDIGMIQRMEKECPIIIKNADGNVYKYLGKYIKGNSPFAYFLDKVSKLEEVDLNGIISGIPEIWEISEAEKESVVRLVKSQIANIDGILEQLKYYFPDWKGV